MKSAQERRRAGASPIRYSTRSFLPEPSDGGIPGSAAIRARTTPHRIPRSRILAGFELGMPAGRTSGDAPMRMVPIRLLCAGNNTTPAPVFLANWSMASRILAQASYWRNSEPTRSTGAGASFRQSGRFLDLQGQLACRAFTEAGGCGPHPSGLPGCAESRTRCRGRIGSIAD